MQVRYDEGVANHIGLEPSAVAREGGGEASVGGRHRCERGRQHGWARERERPDGPTNIDATHWQINYNGGASHEIITFSNAAPVHPSDFIFV